MIGISFGCKNEINKPLYSELTSDQTGIYFENTVNNSATLNITENPLLFNGAGVGIGDINNDGLPDLFFAGNKVSSKLYLNKGNMQFKDVTKSAGIATKKWITGVSMIDINNDGYLDIYLSVVSTEDAPSEDRANLLFINNGNNTFTELASKYGVNDTSHTIHSTFLDYNKDGYLDLYLLNHSPGSFYSHMVNIQPKTVSKSQSKSYDRLYRNNGNGTFTDVSKEAGILQKIGYGLGVVVNDFNNDNWPDIYISNDLVPNDVLYINNKNGTFSNKTSEYLKQTSFAGMGVDAADFNNDGFVDILQVDMMPKDYTNRKIMSGAITFEHFKNLRKQGYHYSYSKNTLQLNQGFDAKGNMTFSEISRLANVAYTNWSWSGLFGDYNNDGNKDIFISNGYPKAVNNFDYIQQVNNASQFGTDEVIKKRKYNITQKLHSIKRSNYLFKNEGNLKFSDRSKQWGFKDPSYSYGTAHGDLDNDGDLDLVINNINATASIYQNNSSELGGNHYLLVKLEGDSLNRQGIGTKLTLTSEGQKQYAYQTLWRGYMSTVDQRIHFGLGISEVVDSLEVLWPDGRTQLLTNIKADQQITLDYKNAESSDSLRRWKTPVKNQVFHTSAPQQRISHTHQMDLDKVDYEIQPLLPYQISRQGPPLASGDVTGNGLDDVFIGGSSGYGGTIFLQQKDGGFVESAYQPWKSDSLYADWGAHFFDANGNGRLDLYVASGGYQLSPASELLQDRLYINMGEGRFVRDAQALPNMLTSTSAVVSGDFTGDNQPDLFVGGRLTPRNYPYPARSWILENNGGEFQDVTNDVAPELADPGGMITDAVWIDFNGDKRLDLVTVGEWMPIQFFENNDNKHLRHITSDIDLPPTRGWWYSLVKGDFNGDGSPDLIAGNLGQNFTYTTSEEQQFGVFADDFNQDMTTDIILSVKENDTYYPFFGKAKFAREITSINSRFPTFQSFAEASLSDIFGTKALDRALHYSVDTFASVYLKSNGSGDFTLTELPKEAQLSAIMGIVSEDVDKDGHMDIILAGNIYHTDPETPRNDAGNGLWMRGDGNGGFEPIPPFKSGLYASGNVKNLQTINTSKGKALLIANHNDSTQVILIKSENK